MKRNQILRKFLLPAFLFHLSYCCFAQVTQEWVARYNGTGNHDDRASAMVIDNGGNIYVTGASNGILVSGPDAPDYVTIKYKNNGNVRWLARYDGTANREDRATAVAVDPAGNVYVTGYSSGAGTNMDYATIKYNSLGVQQWVTRYNGPAALDDEANSLALDAGGNVYVTGWSTNLSGNQDYVTIKYNSAGVQQWLVRYNGPTNRSDRANKIVVNQTGVYVTGDSYIDGSWLDYVTIKYSMAGVLQWLSRYNGPANYDDYSSSLAVDPGGNVYVTGRTASVASDSAYYGFFDCATIKYNAAGIQEWAAVYDGPGHAYDGGTTVVADLSGNVYVTGSSVGTGSEGDYATIKYNAAGVQQWIARYNGPSNHYDVANALALDHLGNVYVTGRSEGKVPYPLDCATVKYNSMGAQIWAIRYSGPAENGEDLAGSLAVDSSGNVYIAGQSENAGSYDDDYLIIKYSQAVVPGARIITPGPGMYIPSSFRVSNYPNPVSAITKIRFELPVDAEVILNIYNLTGNEVAQLVSGNTKAGYHDIDFDVSLLKDGVYYYTITASTGKQTLKRSGKITVIK